MKVLFVDCCMKNDEESRTKRLCNAFLKEVEKLHPDYEIETLVLKDQDLQPYRRIDVEKRNQVIASGELNHSILRYAKQFAEAERILIGAPYWDLSFPALLKIYLEHVFANEITFKYEGPVLVGLCKAKKMMYIQTAGGFVEQNEPGAMYLKAACEMFGINEFQKICADGIDIKEIPQEPRIEAAMISIKEAAIHW